MTEFVGTGEIQARYGINRIQVLRLLGNGEFPEPVQELKRGKLWDGDEVAARVLALKREGRVTASGKLVPRRFLDTP